MKLPAACLLTMLLAPAAFFSQANTYFLHNPVWKVYSSFRVSNGQYLRNEIYNYYIKGDTLIDTLVYKKVYKKGMGSYSDMWGSPGSNLPGPYQYSSTAPHALLRSAGKQMFTRTSSGEALLYDFGLQVGDTLPLSYIHTAGDITVASIDSVYTPYGYRKRFALNNFQSLVEGIGYSKGLVEYMGTTFDGSTWLQCYSLNDTAWFPSAGPTCNLPVGILEQADQAALPPSPNPFRTITTIHLGSTVSGAGLSIYDQFGKKVRTLNDISGDKVTIERGSLSPGLYYFELTNDGRPVASGKLVAAE